MIPTRKYIVWGLLGTLLYSCQSRPLLSGYSPVDRTAWHRTDTVVITMNGVLQTDEALSDGGTLMVGVRYTDEYRYKNISLLVELTDKGKIARRDTVHFDLYDQDGNRRGRGLGYHDVMQPAFKIGRLNGNGQYAVRITHLMRLNPVQGITEVSCLFDCAQHPSSEK